MLSYQNSLSIWTAAEACVGHGIMPDSIPYAMFKSAIPSLIFTYEHYNQNIYIWNDRAWMMGADCKADHGYPFPGHLVVPSYWS